MHIIVQESKPIISARVGQLSLTRYDKLQLNRVGLISKNRAFNFLNPNELTRHNNTIEDLLRSINRAQSPEQLPDIIRFSYDQLETAAISVSDLAASVRFGYKLAARRLNIKEKPVTLTGVCKNPISYAFKEELNKNNFTGGIMGVSATSPEESAEMSRVWKKDNGFWDKRAVLPKISEPKLFDLTFRQEQILQLIKTRALSNGQIANMLKISESTVKMHVGLILKKYGLRNRLQLVTYTY